MTAALECYLARHVPRYTEGDCWVLALALSEQSGWPVAVTAGESHAFVIDPDKGLVLDIRGLRPLEELLAEWGERQQPRVFATLNEAKAHFERNGWGGCQFSRRIEWKLTARVAARLLGGVQAQTAS